MAADLSRPAIPRYPQYGSPLTACWRNQSSLISKPSPGPSGTGKTLAIRPIAEEILFRGTIFAGMNRAWGFWPAALGSGLLFAVAHAQSGLIIPFTLVGVTLAYVYRRAGSIYASMSLHFLFNCISFLALLLIPGARS